jgi:hypothetical protein
MWYMAYICEGSLLERKLCVELMSSWLIRLSCFVQEVDRVLFKKVVETWKIWTIRTFRYVVETVADRYAKFDFGVLKKLSLKDGICLRSQIVCFR